MVNNNQWLSVVISGDLPSGKRTKSYGKSPSLIGKSAISMGHVQ